MDMNEYQQKAKETAIYDGKGKIRALDYLVPGLCAEAGELAGKWAKYRRGDKFGLDIGAISFELGDVLWFVAQIATELQLRLEGVAEANVAKLADRAARGVLGGSGDNR